MPKNHRAVTCSFWILCECFALKTNAELLDHVWVQENMVGLEESASAEGGTHRDDVVAEEPARGL